MSYSDEEWAKLQPIYRSRLARVRGSAVVGTYLFISVTVGLSAWILRKLWHHSGDSNWKHYDEDE